MCKTGQYLFQDEVHERYLVEKFGTRWLARTVRHLYDLKMQDTSWLKHVLFNPSSRMARQVTAQMVESLCTSVQRRKEVLFLKLMLFTDLSTGVYASGRDTNDTFIITGKAIVLIFLYFLF